MGEIASIFLGFVLAFGLDKFLSKNSKEAIDSFASNWDYPRFRKAVASNLFDWYARFFGRNISNYSMWLKSLLVYVSIFIISLVYFSAFNLPTYDIIMQPIFYGTAAEAASWICVAAIGFGAFTLSNAQTIYFLELLKNQAKTFQFFIISYSDFIVTSSIGIIGSALAMISSIFLISHFERVDLHIEVDFSQSFLFKGKSYSEIKSKPYLLSNPKDAGVEADYIYKHSQNQLTLKNHTFRLAQKYDQVTPWMQFDRNNNAIEILNERGAKRYTYYNKTSSIGRLGVYVKRDELASGTSDAIKITEDQFRKKVCASMGSMSLNQFDRLNIILISDAKELVSACERGEKVSLVGRVNLESDNIKWAKLLSIKSDILLSITLSPAPQSLSMYVLDNPYSILKADRAWEDRVVYDERYRSGEELIKAIFLDSLLDEKSAGSELPFYNRGGPIGSIFSISLLTSIPSLVLLFLVLFLSPLTLSRRMYLFISGYIEFENYKITALTLSVMAPYFAIIVLISVF